MKLKINELILNKENPRYIKDYRFNQLVQSIKDFPEMLELRPIVIDEDNVILGGNMRTRACIKAGLDEIPVKVAEGLSEEQKREFIIKDNASFGEWEWDTLANDWDSKELGQWGVDIPLLNERLEVVEDSSKPEIEISEEVLEEHNYIVFTFDNKLDWQVAKDLLDIKTVCKAGGTDTYRQTGVGRVKKGTELINLLQR